MLRKKTFLGVNFLFSITDFAFTVTYKCFPQRESSCGQVFPVQVGCIWSRLLMPLFQGHVNGSSRSPTLGFLWGQDLLQQISARSALWG